MSLTEFAEMHIGERGEVLPYLETARVTVTPRMKNKTLPEGE